MTSGQATLARLEERLQTPWDALIGFGTFSKPTEVRSCIETFLRGLRERGFCIRGLPLHTEAQLVSICDPAGKDIPPPCARRA